MANCISRATTSRARARPGHVAASPSSARWPRAMALSIVSKSCHGHRDESGRLSHRDACDTRAWVPTRAARTRTSIAGNAKRTTIRAPWRRLASLGRPRRRLARSTSMFSSAPAERRPDKIMQTCDQELGRRWPPRACKLSAEDRSIRRGGHRDTHEFHRNGGCPRSRCGNC